MASRLFSHDCRDRFRPFIRLLPFFALVRLLYYALGLRFWAGPLDFYYQFLDPLLLKTRLLESLWYLHCQPPLLNLLSGIVLKISGDAYVLVFHGVNLLVSLGTWIAIAKGLETFRVNRWFAWIAGLALCSTPQFVFYENMLFYPHLCLGLLSFALFAALRSRLRPGVWLGVFFLSLSALALLRSIYHPLYAFAIVYVAASMAAKADRRKVVRLAVVPLALILLVCFKNLVVFGFFGTTTWTGSGLHKVAVRCLDRWELVPLIESGEISVLSLHQEYSSGDVFLKYCPTTRGDYGVPATDNYFKSSDHPDSDSPPINANHWVYLDVCGVLVSDSIAIARHFPSKFLQALWVDLQSFLSPVTRDFFIHHFMLHDDTVLARTTRAAEAIEDFFLVKYGPIALFLIGLRRVARKKTPDPAERFALFFVYATVFWATVISCLFESGENNRYRYEILGLVYPVACREAYDLFRFARDRSRKRLTGRGIVS
ncbi:hypothetical protein JW916_01095 [Candidatus Sumerlaeota bacterium]|nr:hypothetical protein [Candidatus Sumerlaeota bacterium]